MTTTDLFHKIKGNWNYPMQCYFKNEWGEEVSIAFLYEKDNASGEKEIHFSKLNEHELII